jgi:hypothetical protein
MTPEQLKQIDEDFNAEYKKMPKGSWDETFGLAPIKAEGQPTELGVKNLPKPPIVQTTWIEFPIPRDWEDSCMLMIQSWIKAKIEETGIDWEM